MSEKIIKGRDWAFIVYPESAPENWREILDETHIRWIESPLHDKDLNPDNTPKKPHWHVMLSSDGPISLKAVTKIVEPLNVPAPLSHLTLIGKLHKLAKKLKKWDEKSLIN